MNILVAEDQETSRYIVSSHLRNWGHNVVEVDNGKAALAHLAGSPKNAIDVLITDWDMPHMDGVELARQLDAALITFEGAQHTVVFNGDACVDTAVLDFFVDSVPPAAGLRC